MYKCKNCNSESEFLNECCNEMMVCDACKGKGKIEDETCWHCDGYCIDPVKELKDAI